MQTAWKKSVLLALKYRETKGVPDYSVAVINCILKQISAYITLVDIVSRAIAINYVYSRFGYQICNPPGEIFGVTSRKNVSLCVF